ncbi:MAG: response regulator [Bacteroidota bacterium]
MTQTDVDILLVEDTRSDAEMTIRALTKNLSRQSILHLEDGREALDYLFSINNYSAKGATKMPRVVLMDLKMPRIDGIEALAQLKSNELTRKIPVVMLTSSRENPDIQKCYELGANSYIVKPVEFADFSKVVSDLGLYWLSHNQPSA